MARPKNQGARREALIDAAGRAISERGIAGLRIKDIAAEAGVSAGSVLYYYPDLDDLVFEVHQGAVERFLADRHSRTDHIADPVARLREAIASGLPADADDAAHRLLYELHSRADRSASHAALMGSLFARETALYATILELGAASGDFTLTEPLQDTARNLVTLEDGYGLHIVSRNTAVDRTAALRMIAGYARTVTGCPELCG
ncbi:MULTISPECIES: TetR family transcriptional regulator [unclassified Streptomyces]|uniref:TetR/AcrR family transcriptional regulator n=2 Tax=Streptomyces TaxID=1883 RepID=UPI002E12895E|nr:TetR family transcriptional regulator [Streptomyces sp. NBC_01197]WSS52248.1 TetR family transcriptional regulator [Streptomyces sp. NBC_01180]